MAIIYINNDKYVMDDNRNLLQNCLSFNIDIPYFCWHPDLGSAGVCRLCAVKQYNNVDDKCGKIVMACMTPSLHNTIISTVDPQVLKFRKGIIELLMTNHPHDCPICEEGGNCHLQDMTVMTKHNFRRYIYKKRTHKSQYLGDFISHQMNRCISCYRCVRYYKDYAGGNDFGVYGIGNNVYFGRFKDGVLENEHSGNLIEVCPTGVFTDKLNAHNYSRKWDLQYSPSICQHCSIGCNINIGERYGRVNKIDNRYHPNINGYFLCDLGRFGYGYTNLKNRIKYPIQKKNNYSIPVSKQDTIMLVSNILKNNKHVIGVGSNRSSIENNFSLRELVGVENFSSGMCNTEHLCIKLIIDILKNSGIYTPTIREIESYDLVLIIGEDITQVAPRMDLAIRKLNKNNHLSSDNKKDIPSWHSVALLNASNTKENFVYILYTHEIKLSSIASFNYYASVQEQENFACSIADYINKKNICIKHLNTDVKDQVCVISQKLLSCKKPLIVSGSSLGSRNLIKSAVNIAKGLQSLKKDVGLVLLTASNNSIGVGMMSDISLNSVFNKVISNQVDTLIVLENDLYRNEFKGLIDIVCGKLKNLIVLDNHINKTVKKSTLFIPISNFSEGSGTIINYEGRVQRFFSVFSPKIYNSKICILEGWQWLYKICFDINKIEYKNTNLDSIIREYIKKIPNFDKVKHIILDSSFRFFGKKIARSHYRISGRTSIFSHINIHEPAQLTDNNTIFSFSMEGVQQPQTNFSYLPFVWSPGWNSIQSWNKYLSKTNVYNSGVRLFKTCDIDRKYFFHDISCRIISKDEWSIVPYYLLFGNEELSQKSSVIKKKCIVPYALINVEYKKIVGLNKKYFIKFYCSGQLFRISVKFSEKFPLKHIGLPVGRYGIPKSLIGQTIQKIRGII